MPNLLCRLFGIFCPEPTPDPGPTPPLGDRAATAFDLINMHRKQNDLPELDGDPSVLIAAQNHAEEMERTGNLTHDGFSKRLALTGYSAGSENIAAGYQTANDVVSAWMQSPGHRRNILGSYQKIGIGVSGNYWCAIFTKNW